MSKKIKARWKIWVTDKSRSRGYSLSTPIEADTLEDAIRQIRRCVANDLLDVEEWAKREEKA